MKCWPDHETAKVEQFDYPPVSAAPLISWEAFGSLAVSDGEALFENKQPAEMPDANRAAANEAHEDELRRSFESGRECGFEEGRTAEREACAALIKARETRQAEEAAHLLESFQVRCARYFETVEREVVKLSLAIAARVLRREAHLDPMLLSGAVRAALGQFSGSTQACLRVPPATFELWKETIASLPNLPVKPAVVAGDEMNLTECILQTDFGSADLSVSEQLAEIERGFVDCARPDRARTETIEIAEDMSE
jgi:flagellar assembly protein FliH